MEFVSIGKRSVAQPGKSRNFDACGFVERLVEHVFTIGQVLLQGLCDGEDGSVAHGDDTDVKEPVFMVWNVR
jgi:hypothetical protein